MFSGQKQEKRIWLWNGDDGIIVARNPPTFKPSYHFRTPSQALIDKSNTFHTEQHQKYPDLTTKILHVFWFTAFTSVFTRDQTILQNLIFFYCHEILCMIYHIRAKTYGFFSVGCSQSCIPGPKVG